MKVMFVVEGTDLEGFDRIEDLFLVENQLEVIKAKYEANGLKAPGWLADKLSETQTEIKTRIVGDLQKELRKAELQRAGLRTAEEKRKDLDSQIESLKTRLGK